MNYFDALILITTPQLVADDLVRWFTMVWLTYIVSVKTPSVVHSIVEWLVYN